MDQTIIPTTQQNIFLFQSYCSNAQRQENGEWLYSIEKCIHEFRNEFPTATFSDEMLREYVPQLLERLRTTGSVREPELPNLEIFLTSEKVELIKALVEENPKMPPRKLSKVVYPRQLVKRSLKKLKKI
ncbi:uncharacterized protein LOC123012155 isoform X2 [Tribolium madens]|uniref:uncharacterized protein LOC123012155 isoform X2 n=1 Tax=Tribolium madens TaxID=41895 RepID=UPI001CF756A3|nr:uncharacterized protein LOC123012155 isoform X2 [Tribolium madens]